MYIFRKLTTFAALFAIVLLAAGCRTSPFYNVEAAPFRVGGSATMDDITKAIQIAGASLGWRMKATGSGEIEGILLLREHMAQVGITYDTKSYSIQYQNSTNLKYDGNVIHSNYNGWIQNLENAIAAQLSLL